MKSSLALRRVVFVLSLALSGICWAATGPALIVHDGTPGIEADVLGNLTTKLTAAGDTVTANVGVPAGSLATYVQIWDIRFNNTTPLSAGDITAYVTYLNGGGALFVMGENAGFVTRDNSIISLISAAGGGTIALTTPQNAQVVQSPFTGPNAITANTVTFLAANGTTNPAMGGFVSKDVNNNGAAIVYGPGGLTNALTGSLIVVFDVNFLQAGADENSQAFTANLIAYLAAPVVIPPAFPASPNSVPTLSEWAMILLACGLIFLASRRLLPTGTPA